MTKNVLTCAGGGGRALTAFTMAEILLSLTIIGVVAAITLPSLTGNINERTWNTQRKALYARFSQAMALMPALNGYGQLTNATEETSAVDTAAETFVTDGLSKVMKINNICDNEHLADCGIPSKVVGLNGAVVMSEFPKNLFELNSKFSGQVEDTKAAAFETQNGESIAVFYNPRCRNIISMVDLKSISYPVPFHVGMCANFIYDLNGSKGPNTIGKDIGFITAMYPTDPVVVAPMPLNLKIPANTFYNEVGTACSTIDPDLRIPRVEEFAALHFNKTFWGENFAPGHCFWSGGLSGFCFMFSTGSLWPLSWTGVGADGKFNVWCVKR